MQKTARPWPQHLTPSFRTKMNRCGNRRCRCSRGELHGPYWYAYWKEGGKRRQAYIGVTLPPDLARLVGAGPPPSDGGERIERLKSAYAVNPHIPIEHAERVLALLEDLHRAFLVPLKLAEKEARSARRPSRLLSLDDQRKQALLEIDPAGVYLSL